MAESFMLAVAIGQNAHIRITALSTSVIGLTGDSVISGYWIIAVGK